MVAQNISGVAEGTATGSGALRGTGQISGAVAGSALPSGLLTYRREISGSTGSGAGGSILDEAVEVGLTLKQSLRLVLASTAGKLSGAGTGVETIRNPADTKDRIVATVDQAGNRSAIAYDVSD